MSTIPSLVDVAWLAEHLHDSNILVVDTRWYLLNPPQGATEYAESHIAGAIHLSIDSDLSAPPFDGPGRHPLPRPEQVIRTFSAAGIDATVHVVVYDSAGGSIATRLWWMLRYYGHTGVSILDGGWQAWQAAAGATTNGIERRAPRTFIGSPDTSHVVDADTVDSVKSEADVALIDARASERYTGEVEPFGPRAGHIPGAISLPFAGNLTPAGTFKSPAELRERYVAAGIPAANHIICYCGSGVTATHDIFALHLIGRHARLYEGSWSDWASTQHRPIQTGDQP